MAKGLPIHTGNPEILPGEFDNIPDGVYMVNGIEEFLPNCIKDGQPIFTEILGKPKISMKLRRTDGQEGPAYSATAAEFLALVRAFGGDWGDTTITRANRSSSAILLAGQKAANAGAKTLSVTCKKGWVNWINEATAPKGRYTVRFTGAHRSDYQSGNYDFVESKNGGTLIFDFEIVGDGSGNKTIWEGFPISIFMNNDFVREKETFDGKHLKAMDEGIPLYRSTGNGGIPASASRWNAFATYFAPSLFEHVWQTDAANSAYNVCEVLRPQYVFINKALEDKKTAVVYYGEKARGKGFSFDLNHLSMTNEEPSIEIEETPQPQVLDDLIQYIKQDEALMDITIFEQSGKDNSVVFTEEGVAWARKFMLPTWTRLNFGDTKPLHELTEDQLSALLAGLKEDLSK